MTKKKQQIADLISSFYSHISGKAGQRDWESFRKLFHPGAIVTQTGVGEKSGEYMAPISVDEYIEFVNEIFKSESFYEKEIKNQIDVFNDLGHAWSTFQVHGDRFEQPRISAYTFQFCHDGKGWKIFSVSWHSKEDTLELNDQYL